MRYELYIDETAATPPGRWNDCTNRRIARTFIMCTVYRTNSAALTSIARRVHYCNACDETRCRSSTLIGQGNRNCKGTWHLWTARTVRVDLFLMRPEAIMICHICLAVATRQSASPRG